ncbi:MAG TPA: hypothetical protein PKD10_07795 [Paracoccaceae bacterium]|nr:hypothetical protein [Paracoccaceae bacterium]HMO70644.1 hypothetical protein [Paracoccaceae bacterium]
MSATGAQATVGLGGAQPVVGREQARDLRPDLTVPNGQAMDKVDGFAVDAAASAGSRRVATT